jgi:hypothetical protein
MSTTPSTTTTSGGYNTKTVTVSGGSATNTTISSSSSIVLIGTFKVENGSLKATANEIKNGSSYSYTATASSGTLSKLPLGYYTLVETKVPNTYGLATSQNWYLTSSTTASTSHTFSLTESTARLKMSKVVSDGVIGKNSSGTSYYTRSVKHFVFSGVYGDSAIKDVKYTLYDTSGTNALAYFSGSANGHTCLVSSDGTANYCLFASVTTKGTSAGLTVISDGGHTNNSTYSSSHYSTIKGLKANTTYYLKETGNSSVYESAITKLFEDDGTDASGVNIKSLCYDSSKKMWKVTTGKAGTTKTVAYSDSNETADNHNEIGLNFTKSTSVTISKKDKNGNNLINSDLAGTTFYLFYRDSLTSAPNVTTGTVNTTDNPGYITRDAKAGTGTYLLGTFTINKDGELVATPYTVAKTIKRPDGTGYKTVTYTASKSSDGTTLTNLPLGYYSLVEVQVPVTDSNYTLAGKITKKLDGSETTDLYTIDVTEPIEGDPIEITVEKESSNSLEAPKSLEGTVFEVKYYQNTCYTNLADANSNVHNATVYTWYIEAQEDDSADSNSVVYKAKLDSKHLLKTWNGNVSSDLLENGLTTGTVTIKEVEAAEGYITGSGNLTDENGTVYTDKTFIGYMFKTPDGSGNTIYRLTCYGEDESTTVTSDLKLILTNDEYRGDLSFTKINSDGDTLSNVDFNLSLLDDNGNVVETKEITTDENGNFNSADDSELWFYNSSDESSYDTDKVNKDLGSLITGATYRLTELECDANITYGITDSFTFTMPTKEELEKGTYDVKVATASTSGVSYDVYLKAYLDYGAEHSDGKTYKDRVVATLYFKDSKGVTKNGLVNEYVQLSTTATDVNTESHVGVVGKTTLSDTVSYNGTRSGVTYEVVTKLKLDDGTALTDSDGNEITQTNVFTTDGTTGTYTITQDIDADDLGGRSVVFYEYLYLLTYSNNTKEDLDLGEDTTDTEDTDSTDTEETVTETFVGKHESLDSALQTVYFPTITTALNFTSGEDFQYEGSATSFTDTVEVTNLVTGSNYKVKSVIYDKTAGTLYVSDDGETYLGTATLTAGENYKATADVDFLVNTLGLGDHELVCYEYLYYVKSDGTEVLVNAEEDMNNTAQTKVITTLPKLPSTGSRTGLIVNTLAVLLIGIGLYFIFRKRTVEQLGTHRFFGRKTGK